MLLQPTYWSRLSSKVVQAPRKFFFEMMFPFARCVWSNSKTMLSSSGDADSWPVQSFQGCFGGMTYGATVCQVCVSGWFRWHRKWSRCFVCQEAFSCAQKRCLWLDGACVPPTGCEVHHSASFILPINDAFKKLLSRQLISTFLEWMIHFFARFWITWTFSLFDWIGTSFRQTSYIWNSASQN